MNHSTNKELLRFMYSKKTILHIPYINVYVYCCNIVLIQRIWDAQDQPPMVLTRRVYSDSNAHIVIYYFITLHGSKLKYHNGNKLNHNISLVTARGSYILYVIQKTRRHYGRQTT